MLRKILICILIVASVLWIAFIFSNSMANGEQSSAQSSSVTEAVNKVASAVGIEQEIPESTVRDMAHFSEFAILSVLFSATVAVFLWSQKGVLLSLAYISLSVPSCFLLACIDELIQKFSDGRAAQLTDVLLDTLGSLCGTALFCVCYLIFTYILQKRDRKKHSLS